MNADERFRLFQVPGRGWHAAVLAPHEPARAPFSRRRRAVVFYGPDGEYAASLVSRYVRRFADLHHVDLVTLLERAQRRL